MNALMNTILPGCVCEDDTCTHTTECVTCQALFGECYEIESESSESSEEPEVTPSPTDGTRASRTQNSFP